MKEIIKTIEQASSIFMNKHVLLNEKALAEFKITDTQLSVSFFKPPKYLNSLYTLLPKKQVHKIIHVYNAINASLQYSFFLGNATVRFDSIDSFWVMGILDDIFSKAKITNIEEIYTIKDQLIKSLINSNITMLDTRIDTINEVFEKLDFIEYAEHYSNIEHSIKMLKKLVCFKKDIFFKKGIFSIMITNRMIPQLKNNKLYKKQLSSLPVPADYQIPKMLRHFKLIKISKKLAAKIDNNEILLENSEEELNIRAATVRACKTIAKNNKISIDEVDAYFFMLRKNSSLKHHLCSTTNY